MPMKIIFATNNEHKLKEVRALLPDFEIISLKDIGCFEDIAETGKTLIENAKIKADFISKNFGLDCFADDTGLEITSLNMHPGVYSARYAGEPSNSKKNMDKVLLEMKSLKNRHAQFKTVIALNIDQKTHLFEGICEGEILSARKGVGGFGYDPIFQPSGFTKSFAEMSMVEKSEISHRGKSINKLVSYLSTLNIE
jgi:XTP/dITP diphosphohydrolase